MVALTVQPTDILRSVTSAIADAARATGSGFDYLLKTAVRESSLDPNAKANTSTATGLFQFINSTWLQTVKEEGPRLGLAAEASAIEKTADGRYVVRDAATREKILGLRNDPKVAALVAGAFTNRNAAILQQAIGRAPTGGELYIAHFMGPGGATKLISAAATTPNANAAQLFPDAAAANRPIFYDKAGQPRSVAQVYANLVAKHEQTTPAALPAQATVPVPAALSPAAVTSVTPTQAPYVAPRFTRDTTRPVYGLFSSDGGDTPVSPFVRDLWGKPAKIQPDRTQVASLEAPATPNAVPAATALAPTALPLRSFPFAAAPPARVTQTLNTALPKAAPRASGPPLELSAFRDVPPSR